MSGSGKRPLQILPGPFGDPGNIILSATKLKLARSYQRQPNRIKFFIQSLGPFCVRNSPWKLDLPVHSACHEKVGANRTKIVLASEYKPPLSIQNGPIWLRQDIKTVSSPPSPSPRSALLTPHHQFSLSDLFSPLYQPTSQLAQRHPSLWARSFS